MKLNPEFRSTLGPVIWAGLLALALGSPSAMAQDIKIAHVYDKTGPLEAYAKQTQTGLMMGLNYATGGTMTVNGHKLVVIEKDNQGKPDVGKSQLASAFADDKADLAVGPTSSGVALAMLPVAEEYKKILIVEPAAGDPATRSGSWSGSGAGSGSGSWSWSGSWSGSWSWSWS